MHFTYDVLYMCKSILKYIHCHPLGDFSHDSDSSVNIAVAAPYPYQVCCAIVASSNLPTLQSAR